MNRATAVNVALFALAGYGLGMALRLSQSRAMLVGVAGVAIYLYGRRR